MTETQYHVYILATKRNGTFYVGVTSDLPGRTWQHKNGIADGFTKKYEIRDLVYFETFGCVHEAIRREKRLKKWTRESKMKAIEEMNPEWKDLYDDICA